MAYKCVPWNPAWANADHLDIYAIYRRPHTDRWGKPTTDASGAPEWDYVRLAVKRHNTWAGKGWHYVTLADLPSLQAVSKSLAAQGLDWRSFVATPPPESSPWDAVAFLADQQAHTAEAAEDLKALAAEFGLDALVKIKRQTDPTWQPTPEIKAAAAKAGKK
jgi:hypothetical protein